MQTYLALDIGGTHLRAACFEQTGIIPLAQIKTRTPPTQEDPLSVLLPLLAGLIPPGSQPAGIALAIPGLVDQPNQRVGSAVNLPGWESVPLGAALQARFNCPVQIENDARLACLGEARYGAGQGCLDLIYLTIGTGIGTGILSQGVLLRGSRGMGSEAGHILLDPDGPLCGCGQRGHLEALASGPAIAREAWRRLQTGETSSLSHDKTPTSMEVGRAALAGDALALAAFANAGEWIGAALASLVHLFNPQRILLGGGVSLTGECLLTPVRRSLAAHVMDPDYLKDVDVLPAGLGDDSGLLGALALARNDLT